MQQQKITGRDNGQGQARVETRLSAVAGARDHAHALATVNLEPVSDLVAAQLACRAANCAASDLEPRFPTKLHQPLWMLPCASLVDTFAWSLADPVPSGR